MSDITYFLLPRTPPLVLALVGILIALVLWKRHPKVSLLASLGLVLFLVESLTFMSVYYYLPRLIRTGWTLSDVNTVFMVAQVCQDCLFAVVIVLLVAAAFSSRQPQISDSVIVSPNETHRAIDT